MAAALSTIEVKAKLVFQIGDQEESEVGTLSFDCDGIRDLERKMEMVRFAFENGLSDSIPPLTSIAGGE